MVLSSQPLKYNGAGPKKRPFGRIRHNGQIPKQIIVTNNSNK